MILAHIDIHLSDFQMSTLQVLPFLLLAHHKRHIQKRLIKLILAVHFVHHLHTDAALPRTKTMTRQRNLSVLRRVLIPMAATRERDQQIRAGFQVMRKLFIRIAKLFKHLSLRLAADKTQCFASIRRLFKHKHGQIQIWETAAFTHILLINAQPIAFRARRNNQLDRVRAQHLLRVIPVHIDRHACIRPIASTITHRQRGKIQQEILPRHPKRAIIRIQLFSQTKLLLGGLRPQRTKIRPIARPFAVSPRITNLQQSHAQLLALLAVENGIAMVVHQASLGRITTRRFIARHTHQVVLRQVPIQQLLPQPLQMVVVLQLINLGWIASQIGQRMIRRATHQALITAINLSIRLLQNGDPLLIVRGLGVNRATKRFAREIVVHNHLLADTIMPKVNHMNAARAALFRDKQALDQKGALRHGRQRATKPTIAQSTLLHILGVNAIFKIRRVLAKIIRSAPHHLLLVDLRRLVAIRI
mmetsp:Transcript_54627/g.90578  ORF Transcript_54627/g.90578 Transcript_54627/m.90578 type:complete len:473 (-) Transcript_54627:801-2219(-)